MRVTATQLRITSLACALLLAPLSGLNAQQPAPAAAPPAPATTPAPVSRRQPVPPSRGQARMAPVKTPMGRGMDERHHPGQFGMGGGPDRMILPGGTWWRNADLAQKVGLSADQQKKMDDALLANRVQLIHMHATLEEEELMLHPLLAVNPLDQKKVMDQISKIADTRASLEKTNAKMLLDMRAVLTPEQWTKLQAERHQGPMMQGGQRPGPANGQRYNNGPHGNEFGGQ